MLDMIPELFSIAKYVVLVGGGSVLTLFLSKWLGKKKEEVELALDWQKFYNGHIENIKNIHKEEIETIKKLHEKQIEDIKVTFRDEIAELIKKVEELKASKEEADRLRLLWEDDSSKKAAIIKEKDQIIHEQETELETYRE